MSSERNRAQGHADAGECCPKVSKMLGFAPIARLRSGRRRPLGMLFFGGRRPGGSTDLHQIDIRCKHRESLSARALPGPEAPRRVSSNDDLRQVMAARVRDYALSNLSISDHRCRRAELLREM